MKESMILGYECSECGEVFSKEDYPEDWEALEDAHTHSSSAHEGNVSLDINWDKEE